MSNAVDEHEEAEATFLRAVLLDDAAEERWSAALATYAQVRVQAGDWSAADAWLEEKIVSAPFRRACAEWVASLLRMEPAVVFTLSPPLVSSAVARLREATGNDGAFALCLRSLGWEGAARPAAENWSAFAEPALQLPRPRFLVEARGHLAAALEHADRMVALRIPVGLRAEADEWHAFIASDAWDRSATRWRRAPIQHSGDWLGTFAPELVCTFEQASHEMLKAIRDPSERVVDRARSAVEALLFGVLEARPATRGRFGLNELLDFHFGGRPAEADLADREARLVIEIDGYFHHRDEAAYRRDRRKDALYQEHGWLFLRFLADDVISDLEGIIAQIEHLLARRDASRRI